MHKCAPQLSIPWPFDTPSSQRCSAVKVNSCCQKQYHTGCSDPAIHCFTPPHCRDVSGSLGWQTHVLLLLRVGCTSFLQNAQRTDFRTLDSDSLLLVLAFNSEFARPWHRSLEISLGFLHMHSMEEPGVWMRSSVAGPADITATKGKRCQRRLRYNCIYGNDLKAWPL